MNNLGIVRKMDELGRIVIPKEIRDKYEIYEGTEIEINTTTEGNIILNKYKDTYCPKCLTKCRHTDNFCSKCGLNFKEYADSFEKNKETASTLITK